MTAIHLRFFSQQVLVTALSQTHKWCSKSLVWHFASFTMRLFPTIAFVCVCRLRPAEQLPVLCFSSFSFLYFPRRIPFLHATHALSPKTPSSSWKSSLTAQGRHLFVLLIPISVHAYFSALIYFHLYVVWHNFCPYPRFPLAVKLLKFPNCFHSCSFFFF